MEMSPNANIRLEVIFEILKVFIFYDDFVAFDEYVQIAVPLEKESIDWEKRNQLKVYKALNYSEKGEFRKAAKLFVSSLSTFASEDILPFSDIILMASAFSFISLDRLSLKSQIIDSPEVVSGLADLPSLDLLLKSVYELKYSDFYTALGKLKPIFETNRFLRRHFESFENSAKRVIYGQFLESYVSVTVSSIAESFNVSVEQIYKDFFVYISNGEIEAKVDRQEEVIHRYVKDQQAEAFYKIAEAGQHLSQKAQLLLNKIQNKS
ncbi:hypothetical protein MHBO_000926 [Bonamia ostreae]|uniref:PCI domain-containing protein n=1 Tax=Bonamia ostreae TaxID=126728 RepID=A0ABV2AHB4_9EUKA